MIGPLFRRRRHDAAVALVLLLGANAAQAQPAELIGEVRVHGNHTTPDADVLAIAALRPGEPVTEGTLDEATRRLEESGRFDAVEVRKRYRSIADPSDILLIIIVDEVTGIAEDDLTPGPIARLRSLGMWLPVLDYDDGYGWTYGARISLVDLLGGRSRISAPFTWGGERRAALDVDRAFDRGPISRVEGSVSISRRVNPHFEVPDTRRGVRARAERVVTPWLRVGGAVRRTDVSFGGVEDAYTAPALDLEVDTRTDPGFPRNAMHAMAGVEQLRFGGGRNVGRWRADLRGYVGLVGSAVLALRAAGVWAGGALPAYEQALLGGTATLRGYDLGYRAGDNLAAASVEVRVPITSPLSVGRFGFKGFLDAGTVYPDGARLVDQRFDRGVGGGVFASLAVLRMGLDVAWPVGADTGSPHWHFTLGVTF